MTDFGCQNNELPLISLNKSRYEKLVIGYEFGPEALSIETLVHDLSPAGREIQATAACNSNPKIV
jgi:hypothetical protein